MTFFGAYLFGWGGGGPPEPARAAISLPAWPWWGPRVRVGDREFRPGVRVKREVTLKLTVWDVDQPALRATGGWEAALWQGVAAFRERYPNVAVEVRVMRWSEYDRVVSEALRKGEFPDVLGTPEITYQFDPAVQVPLELYLKALLPSDPSGALLPGALALVSEGQRVWGVPRWAEWTGWVQRTGVQPRRIWLDAGNPLTWRYLSMVLKPPAPGSVWSRERLEAAAAWIASAPLPGPRTRHNAPGRRRDLSLLEPLYAGEAQLVGPISGRLAFRMGWWPSLQGTPGSSPDAALVSAGLDQASLVPGPLISTSSYAVFARPGATSESLQVAVELALHLARWTSRAITGRDGVIPVWNPGWEEAANERRKPAEDAEATAWWRSLALPPGALEVLVPPVQPEGGRRPRPAGRPGPPSPTGVWGALPWHDALHEQATVALAAARLAEGRVALPDFVKQAAAPAEPPGAGPAR